MPISVRLVHRTPPIYADDDQHDVIVRIVRRPAGQPVGATFVELSSVPGRELQHWSTSR